MMKETNIKDNSKLFVGLGSTRDFWRWDSFSTNAKIEEMSKPDGLIYYEVNSLKEASNLVKEFIGKFRLGASNWTGGSVVDENYNFVARVSYNGRVWESEDIFSKKEIVI